MKVTVTYFLSSGLSSHLCTIVYKSYKVFVSYISASSHQIPFVTMPRANSINTYTWLDLRCLKDIDFSVILLHKVLVCKILLSGHPKPLITFKWLQTDKFLNQARRVARAAMSSEHISRFYLRRLYIFFSWERKEMKNRKYLTRFIA